jgi:hypothetical protein
VSASRPLLRSRHAAVTVLRRRVLIALVPFLAINPLWVASHQWFGTAWVSGRKTAFVVQSLRGDAQFLVQTNPAGFAGPPIGVKVTPVPSYGNNYDGRDWNWAGFGYTWDRPEELSAERYGLVACPHWFLSLAAICLPAAVLVLSRRKPGSATHC